MEYSKLNELCEINIGKTPFRNKSEYWGEGSSWLSISDLKDKFITKTKEEITSMAISECNMKIVPKNTVVMSFKLSIGKVAILKEDMYTNEAIANFPIKNNSLIPEYLYYAIKTLNFDNTDRAVMGVTLNKAKLNELKIPYCEINKQKQIVKLLNKAQELIDKRKEQIKYLDELVKSKFIEMFGDPVTNYKQWQKRKLIDECNIVTGNTPSRKVDEYYGNYIEWIKSDNITDSNIYLTKAREYLSEKGLQVGRYVEENSILMTCIAGSIKCIGNVAIANRKIAFNQQINAIEPLNNNVFFMFEQFRLSQQYIQSTINMSLKGILSKGQLSELEFIFPPIELQNQFAGFVKHVDKLKLEMENSLKELEDNFNSLMQRAFKGELFN